MLGALANSNPVLYRDIMDYLDYATKSVDRHYRDRNHAPKKHHWGEINEMYGGGLINKGFVRIAAKNRVQFDGVRPLKLYHAYIGLFCDVDLGEDGFVKIEKVRGVPHVKITSKMLRNTSAGYYIDVSHAFVLPQPNYMSYEIYNDNDHVVEGLLYPILYAFYPEDVYFKNYLEVKVPRVERRKQSPLDGVRKHIEDTIAMKKPIENRLFPIQAEVFEVLGDGAANGTMICYLDIPVGEMFTCTDIHASHNKGEPIAVIRFARGRDLGAKTDCYQVDLSEQSEKTLHGALFTVDNSNGCYISRLMAYAPQTAWGWAINNSANQYFSVIFKGVLHEKPSDIFQLNNVAPIEDARLSKLLDRLDRQEKPLIPVAVKDEQGEEEWELKAQVDPDYGMVEFNERG